MGRLGAQDTQSSLGMETAYTANERRVERALTCQEARAVDALGTGNDLLASNEDIKGIAELWVGGIRHGVEWPNLQPASHSVNCSLMHTVCAGSGHRMWTLCLLNKQTWAPLLGLLLVICPKLAEDQNPCRSNRASSKAGASPS